MHNTHHGIGMRLRSKKLLTSKLLMIVWTMDPQVLRPSMDIHAVAYSVDTVEEPLSLI